MGLAEIQARVTAALRRAERPLDAVTLVAVSKVQPAARVRAVLEAGHRVFGENRVQEAEERWAPLRAEFDALSLHLVGPLQSNKVRRAVEIFDAIHSVDREKLARRIAEAAEAAGRCPDLFIQVNTGREPQKAGVPPDELSPLVEACRDTFGLPLRGLMCIPPVDADPAEHFAILRDLAAREGLAGLSMGMSDDFETAIAYGATHIRIGSAIFGERTSKAP